jgi:hypothetical protein
MLVPPKNALSTSEKRLVRISLYLVPVNDSVPYLFPPRVLSQKMDGERRCQCKIKKGHYGIILGFSRRPHRNREASQSARSKGIGLNMTDNKYNAEQVGHK